MNAPAVSAWAASPPATASFLFRAWLAAVPHVPFRPVFRLDARPRPDRAATRLEKLSRIEFVFRITHAFVAAVTCQEGKIIHPVVLRAEAFAYKLTTLPGPEGLLPAEDALTQIESFLVRQSPDFCAALARDLGRPPASGNGAVRLYRRVPWRSLRLEQPFAAGVVEPTYTFRKAVGRAEFSVGARSGQVGFRFGPDSP